MDQAGEREVVRNADGTALVDHKGKSVAVERFLCTKPLRTEVSTRKGPGGMKLSYMGGDMVTKTLNEAFGYDGWSLEVKDTTREEPILDDKKRYHVAYIATVRITHRRSGAYREDCGAGDSIDRSLATASSHAVKGAVTDAMKRAARHFGEKLGNSLYHDGFNANNAPPTLKDALDALDIDRAKSRFGFEKDRKAMAGQGSAGAVHSAKAPVQAHQAAARNNNAPGGSAKQEATKAAPPSRAPYAQQQTPRTQYVGGVVFESNQKKGDASKPHVTPYHPGATTAARNATTAPATNRKGGGPASTTKGATSFDASLFAAVPAAKLAAGGAKENSNPQTAAPPPPPKAGGLALPPRPGTSRGAQPSPTSAYIANFAGAGGSGAGDAPSMFGAGGTMSQALAAQQTQSQPPPPPGTSIAQSLKRKNEEASAGVVAKAPNTGARNPYNC